MHGVGTSGEPVALVLELTGLGMVSLIGGLLAYARVITYWLRWYADPHASRYYRNGVFVTIPSGLSFIMMGFGIATHRLGEAVFNKLGGAALVAAWLILPVCIWFWLAPPDGIKPPWLVRHPSGRSDEPSRTMSLASYPPVIRAMAGLGLSAAIGSVAILLAG